MASGYLSVKETAEILGYSEQYIRKMLKSGELHGETIGNRWIVAAESASQYHCKEHSDTVTLLLEIYQFELSYGSHQSNHTYKN